LSELDFEEMDGEIDADEEEDEDEEEKDADEPPAKKRKA
jgi:hypothetical protein